ncbi:MAG: hypothetical protein HY718_01100 [Planctomycetes bacterium]|nr:hypothetical protein [Planctomycetota bacterium]
MNDEQDKVLRRLMAVQRIVFWSFLTSLVCIFGGFGLFAYGVNTGIYVHETGWLLLCLLLFNVYFIVTFLRCPLCGHRLFMPDGFLGLLSTMKVTNRKCVHCGLTKAKNHPTNGTENPHER